MSTELQTELDYFCEMRQEWLDVYKDKFVLIKGEKLYGHYDDSQNAYDAGVRMFGNTPFLIRQVISFQEELKLYSQILTKSIRLLKETQAEAIRKYPKLFEAIESSVK